LTETLMEESDLVERALDQRRRGRPPVLGHQLAVQGAGVDADADRYPPLARGLRDLLDVGGVAHVPGVDAEPVNARLDRHHREADREVDVCHDRHAALRDDQRQRPRVTFVRDRHAHDVRALGGELVHLDEGGVDVVGLRRRHRLDGDGGAAADGHGAHAYPPRTASLVSFGHRVSIHR
jgi:hypothetical protein